MDSVGTWEGKGSVDGLDCLFVSVVGSKEKSSRGLVFENLGEYQLMVALPLRSAVVEHGTGGKKVGVKVTIRGIPPKFHLFIDESDRFLSDFCGGRFPNLKTTCSQSCHGCSILIVMDMWRGVSHGAAGQLASFDIIEAFYPALGKIAEFESRTFTGL